MIPNMLGHCKHMYHFQLLEVWRHLKTYECIHGYTSSTPLAKTEIIQQIDVSFKLRRTTKHIWATKNEQYWINFLTLCGELCMNHNIINHTRHPPPFPLKVYLPMKQYINFPLSYNITSYTSEMCTPHVTRANKSPTIHHTKEQPAKK